MRALRFRAWDTVGGRFLFPWPEGFAILGETTCFDLIGQQLKERSPEKSTLEMLNDVVIMQFTGLHDKNGKEIYEGDIVRTQEYTDKPYSRQKRKHRHIGTVRYSIEMGDGFYNDMTKKFDRHGEYAAGWVVEIKEKGKYQCSNCGPFYDCEVIGNIHGNPELMEG